MNNMNGTSINRVATWLSIVVIFLGGGIWAGEIQNEQDHKADKAEVAEMKRDIEYIKEEVEDIKELQREVLREIRKVNGS